MSASKAKKWLHLESRPKSFYRQLFVKGTRIRAEVIYGLTVDGAEPMTPEEVAADMSLPLDAVQEAIAYCQSNPPAVTADHAREQALMEASGMNDPNYKHHAKPKLLSPEEVARIRRL